MEMIKVGTGEHQIVALHGWFGSATGWGLLPEVVDTDAYTWWFPDMRGYGSRRGESGAFTMAEFAADALGAADEAGLDRFSVVGHSMGGKAAAVLAALAGDRARALVPITPVAPQAMPLDADGEALFFGAPADDANRRGIIDFTTGSRNSAAWVAAMAATSRATSDEAAFAGAVASWVRDDYTEQVGQPATPTCVIVGANDPALSADYAAQTWQQLYSNYHLVSLEGCGHYPMFEQPVWLVTNIERFLADT